MKRDTRLMEIIDEIDILLTDEIIVLKARV